MAWTNILASHAAINAYDDMEFFNYSLNKNNEGIYFSRSLIPHNSSQYHNHIGIYCFSKKVLEAFSSNPRSQNELFEQVVVTNSIPVSQEDFFPQLKVLSVANMLGEAIWRIHEESSISSMFR